MTFSTFFINCRMLHSLHHQTPPSVFGRFPLPHAPKLSVPTMLLSQVWAFTPLGIICWVALKIVTGRSQTLRRDEYSPKYLMIPLAMVSLNNIFTQLYLGIFKCFVKLMLVQIECYWWNVEPNPTGQVNSVENYQWWYWTQHSLPENCKYLSLNSCVVFSSTWMTWITHSVIIWECLTKALLICGGTTSAQVLNNLTWTLSSTWDYFATQYIGIAFTY